MGKAFVIDLDRSLDLRSVQRRSVNPVFKLIALSELNNVHRTPPGERGLMSVLVQNLAVRAARHERVTAVLTGEVYRDLAGVEPVWRALEADPAILATPYQRFAWISAFVEAEVGPGSSARQAALRIVVLRDGAGRPRVLLPLAVSPGPVRVARVIGGSHANYHMPLFACREAAMAAPEDMLDALARTGRTAGIDAYDLGHQPRFWDGVANPFAATGLPCASDAYGMLLGPDPEATRKRAFSADARKKLRSKERRLVDAHGPVEHRVAASPEAVEGILQAFYAQKAARFAAMGVADPYAEPAIRRFVALASARNGSDPAVEVHALVARDSGRIFATFGGAVDVHRFSGMWTSFDGDADVSRSSPGDLLLHHLVGQQTAAGRRAFDLGVGEARYKANTCDETIALVRTVVPVTLRGHVFAQAAAVSARAKRRIKRSPRLWAMVGRLRRMRAR